MPLLILANLIVFSDQLDDIRKRSTSESSPQHMSDYLQLPDDYETRKYAPGKKRVSKLVHYAMTVKYLNHTVIPNPTLMKRVANAVLNYVII